MRLTAAYSKIKRRNVVLINNGTHQRETLSEGPIRLPLRFHTWDFGFFIQVRSTMPSFKLKFSLGFITSCYVIFSLSMVHAMDIFMITLQDVTKLRENCNLKLPIET